MSSLGGSSPNTTSRSTLGDDDHDLLTFSEVGERLRVEIAEAESSLAALSSSCDPAELGRARTRLEMLRAAAKRNSAQPINDENFEKFFGYPGKAKRNLDSPREDS